MRDAMAFDTPFRLSLAVVTLCLQAALAVAADFTGQVVGITDGDTISVMHEGRGEKVQLNGIDCPEREQAFGTHAKQFTAARVFDKTVTVHTFGKDRDGRTLGEVVLPDGGILNHELLKAGLAWWYRKYSDDPRLATFEAEARKAKRGLWRESGAVPPWEWRHRAGSDP